MTQEDKELLLKDISGRLPYGLIVQISLFRNDGIKSDIDLDPHVTENIWEIIDKYHALPYLRPMSSMTEEECDMVEEILGDKCIFDFMGNGDIVLKQGQFSQNKLAKLYDYYNSIHVDYRGLIEKGLAIAVTEENNPYEDDI